MIIYLTSMLPRAISFKLHRLPLLCLLSGIVHSNDNAGHSRSCIRTFYACPRHGIEMIKGAGGSGGQLARRSQATA